MFRYRLLVLFPGGVRLFAPGHLAPGQRQRCTLYPLPLGRVLPCQRLSVLCRRNVVDILHLTCRGMGGALSGESRALNMFIKSNDTNQFDFPSFTDFLSAF